MKTMLENNKTWSTLCDSISSFVFWVDILNLVTQDPLASDRLISDATKAAITPWLMFLRQRTNQVHEMIVCQKWPDSSQMEYVEKYTQRGFWSEGSFFASKNQQPRNTQDSTQKSCVLHRASCGASKKVGGSCPFHRNIWKDASTSYDPDASKSGSYLCS